MSRALTASDFERAGYSRSVAAWLDRYANGKPLYEPSLPPPRSPRFVPACEREEPRDIPTPTPPPPKPKPSLDPDVDARYRKRIEQLESELSALKWEYSKAKYEARRAPPPPEYTGVVVAGVFKERVKHLPGIGTPSEGGVRHMNPRNYAICQFYAEGASYSETGKRFGLARESIAALIARVLKGHRPKAQQELEAYRGMDERDALISYVL